MIESKLDPTIKMIVFDKDGEKEVSHITFQIAFCFNRNVLTKLNSENHLCFYIKVHSVTVHHPCITGVRK